jgi:peptidoglycan-N-acetylglucosamine deacetylase
VTKLRILFVVIVVLLIVGAIVSWFIVNSRTFQLFGRIVPRVETSLKIVALTFDDGPTPAGTRSILDVLSKHQVSATFFIIGSELEKNPELGQRIVAHGHELANQSYSHGPMVFVGTAFVQQEVERTDELIREAGFHNEIYFRPPDAKKFVMLPYYLSERGRTTVTWDVDPEAGAGTSDQMVENVLLETRPGSIIRLHVMDPKRTASINAAPKIIEGLKSQGYQFVTVSELLASGN